MLMRLSLLFLSLLLPACVHLFTSRAEYKADGPAPSLGGSTFRAEFIPTGAESGLALSAMVIGAATISETGPYQMRLHAFGLPGDHRWFEIKRLRLSGTDQFDAPMEARGFAGRAEFHSTNTAGSTRASLLLGPHIHLDEKKQRDIVLEADVAIMRRSGMTRGTLRIPLSLNKTRQRESTFILAELWHDMRHRDSPAIPAALPPPPETAD